MCISAPLSPELIVETRGHTTDVVSS